MRTIHEAVARSLKGWMGVGAGLVLAASALCASAVAAEAPWEVRPAALAPAVAAKTNPAKAPIGPAPAAAPAEPTAPALTKTDLDAWLDGFMPLALKRGGDRGRRGGGGEGRADPHRARLRLLRSGQGDAGRP